MVSPIVRLVDDAALIAFAGAVFLLFVLRKVGVFKHA